MARIDEEKFGYLAACLETIVARGFSKGVIHIDEGMDVWCPDISYKLDFYGCVANLPLSRSCPDTSCFLSIDNHDVSEADISILKTSLFRMKSVKRVLDTLSSSLEETIDIVTSKTRVVFQTAGFATLPDELLARIFELTYDAKEIFDFHCSISADKGLTNSSTHFLACVSKRFRRVALSVPFIWRDVSCSHPVDRILTLRERCQNPSVCLKTEKDSLAPSEHILGIIHPSRQWQELHLHFGGENTRHSLFELLKGHCQEPFGALEALLLYNNNSDWAQLEIQPNVASSLRDMDSGILASWRMPRLTSLALSGFLPSATMQCPNVTSLVILINRGLGPNDEFASDMNKLRDLLASLPKLEILYVSFQSKILAEADSPIPLVTLPYLTTLGLVLYRMAKPRTVGLLMDFLGAPNLKNLNVRILRTHRHEWNVLIFKRWMMELFMPSPGQPRRCYSSVERVSFTILENETSDSFPIMLNDMFAALPNIREIKLSLPENIPLDANLSAAIKDGALRHVRSIHIVCPEDGNRNSTTTYKMLLDFLRDQQNSNSLDEFECLHISKHHGSLWYKNQLGRLLGDKLIWDD